MRETPRGSRARVSFVMERIYVYRRRDATPSTSP